MSRRMIAVRMLITALVTLLLCGIVAAELPELLSLTDVTANGFTMRRADSLVLPVFQSAKDVQKAAIDFDNPALDSHFSRAGAFEKAALVLAPPFILHSVLRT
jgi:hypothetical protein